MRTSKRLRPFTKGPQVKHDPESSLQLTPEVMKIGQVITRDNIASILGDLSASNIPNCKAKQNSAGGPIPI
jgi:hypothetical protein